MKLDQSNAAKDCRVSEEPNPKPHRCKKCTLAIDTSSSQNLYCIIWNQMMFLYILAIFWWTNIGDTHKVIKVSQIRMGKVLTIPPHPAVSPNCRLYLSLQNTLETTENWACSYLQSPPWLMFLHSHNSNGCQTFWIRTHFLNPGTH